MTRNIAYGPDPRQKLDVFRPKSGSAKAVVVYLYGGGWNSGDRRIYGFLGAALAGRGVITVVPDYRIHSGVRYPAFVEDAAAAIRWTKDNAVRYGGDPMRIFLMGHSAGAHTAALIALDAQYLAAQGLDRSVIRGVMGLAGPYLFNPVEWASTKDIFSTATSADRVRPIKLVCADAPPMLLLHGSRDKTVEPRATTVFGAAMESVGVHQETKLYSGVGHRGIVASFAWPLRWRAPVLEDVDRFIDERLGESAAA